MNYDPGSNRMRSAPGWREVDLRPRTPIVEREADGISTGAVIGVAAAFALVVTALALTPDRGPHHPRGTDAHGQTPVAP
jgi:hypothetical protein